MSGFGCQQGTATAEQAAASAAQIVSPPCVSGAVKNSPLGKGATAQRRRWRSRLEVVLKHGKAENHRQHLRLLEVNNPPRLTTTVASALPLFFKGELRPSESAVNFFTASVRKGEMKKGVFGPSYNR